MWFPLEKWERGFLFPSRSWEDWTTSGWQNFFVIFFSPLAKWCSFLGKSDSLLSFRGNVWGFFSLTHMKMLSFSKMMLSFSKRMVSFRKVHWVFFLSLELRSSFEKKNSMDFPSGHHPFASGQHHFASGENNCKKFFAIPQYPHPYIIFWQIKTPDFIFQLLSIISHPFGFILQQTPIQNYNVVQIQLSVTAQSAVRKKK